MNSEERFSRVRFWLPMIGVVVAAGCAVQSDADLPDHAVLEIEACPYEVLAELEPTEASPLGISAVEVMSAAEMAHSTSLTGRERFLAALGVEMGSTVTVATGWTLADGATVQHVRYADAADAGARESSCASGEALRFEVIEHIDVSTADGISIQHSFPRPGIMVATGLDPDEIRTRWSVRGEPVGATTVPAEFDETVLEVFCDEPAPTIEGYLVGATHQVERFLSMTERSALSGTVSAQVVSCASPESRASISLLTW